MSTTTKFCNDTSGKDFEQKIYRSIVRRLLYLIASRSNISFSVDTYARYQANPKESHLTSVKRIIIYISGTLNYGLWYPCGSFCVIIGYFDGDWVGNIKHRKNTSCACFFVGACLVTWLSKKQNLISLSTAKAEYIVVGSCCTQLLWMKQMLSDYGIKQSTMSIHCDNSNAINISKNPVFHSWTKHIDIRHHFIRDLVEDKVISLEFVSTKHQLADIFTKPLNSIRFEFLRKFFG